MGEALDDFIQGWLKVGCRDNRYSRAFRRRRGPAHGIRETDGGKKAGYHEPEDIKAITVVGH
jgi:hypothetical protein